MPIRIVCPNCQAPALVAEEQRGQEILCEHCQTRFVAVPAAQADPPAAPRPQPEEPAGRRKVPTAALLLIFGGVAASLLTLVASIGLLAWLWKSGYFNPPPELEPVEASRPESGGVLRLRPDERQDPDAERGRAEEGKVVKELQPPPPPPRELEFASPVPKDLRASDPVAAPATAELARDVVQKVKRATAYLRVTFTDGTRAQGSGFFGVEPQIVLTNAHVVGMLRPWAGPPRSIEVITDSGTKDEKKFTAQVLGVDRSSDLAVLRVAGPGTPPPLEVRSARNLRETQRVWVVGFPFGEGLGKEVTVSDSSVSSLRLEDGVLTRVQVNGGMHPGNSGGPVVDAQGNVIGVAVAVVRNTQINFAIPGDYVAVVFNGRISGLSLGPPYRQDSTVRVPVTMTLIDPLGRVRQPALEVWTAKPQPSSRPPSLTPPAAQPDDSPHQRQRLLQRRDDMARDDMARGEITLPPAQAGKAYWIQPTWAGPGGSRQWATARTCALEPPLERRPAYLALKPEVGSRPLVLNSWLTLQLRDPESGEHALAYSSQTDFTEITRAVDPEEQADVRLEYRGQRMELRVDNQLRPPDLRERRLLQAIATLTATLAVDQEGNVRTLGLDTTRASAFTPEELRRLHEQTAQLLYCLAVPLPNKQVTPGESWTGKRLVPVRWFAMGTAEMTYTYLGSRQRDGRQEAVVAFEGAVHSTPGQAPRIGGRARGTAVVDLRSGQVTQADGNFDVHFPIFQAGRPPEPSTATLKLRFRRALPAAG